MADAGMAKCSYGPMQLWSSLVFDICAAARIRVLACTHAPCTGDTPSRGLFLATFRGMPTANAEG